MMKSVLKALALVCALCIATPLIAAEGGKGQGKGKAGARPDLMGAAIDRRLAVVKESGMLKLAPASGATNSPRAE